jgi:hypothetical protein
MTRECLGAILIASISLVASCKEPSRPGAPKAGVQANTVQQFSFPGGAFKDSRVAVNPDTKVEPGPAKNVVALRRANGNTTTISCFCVLEGGDCWAVSTDTPGSVTVGCAYQNCASGEAPFCLMDISDQTAGFNIRLAVAARK